MKLFSDRGSTPLTSTIPKVLVIMPGGQFGIVATLDDYDTELRIIAAYAELRLKERGEFEDYETDKKTAPCCWRCPCC